MARPKRPKEGLELADEVLIDEDVKRWRLMFGAETMIKKHDDETLRIYRDLVDNYENFRRLDHDNYRINKELYARYVDKWQGTKYFELHHLDVLGWRPNIYIITSEKNVGKTSTMYSDMARRIQRGEKIIFGRLSVNETMGLFNQIQIDGDGGRCPFYMKSPYNSNKAQNRLYVVPGFFPDNPELDNQHCGDVIPWIRCNSKQGATNMGDYTAVYFDEIISWVPTFSFNNVFEGWEAFFSSIVRDSGRALTCYMFGNLAGYKADILDYYGIDKEQDKLKKMNRSAYGEQYADVLYINLGNIYKGGIGSQKRVLQGDPLRNMEMLQNISINLNRSRIPKRAFELLDKYIAYYDRSRIIDLRRGRFEGVEYYALKVWDLDVYAFDGHAIYTDDRLKTATLFNSVYYAGLSTIKKLIYKAACGKMLRYVGDEAIDYVAELKAYDSQEIEELPRL